MDTIWLISYLLLWSVVILMTVAVVLLARQVSLLYRRLGAPPARMENEGPDIGTVPEPAEVVSLDGAPIDVGGLRRRAQLLVFVSTNCLTCDALTPAIRTAWRREKQNVDILTVCMTPDESLARSFINRNKLHEVPCIVAGGLSRQYQIFNPPYGVLLNAEGGVAAKGVVNNLDHIESLLLAAETGHPTVESYIQALNTEEVLAVK
jgi:methylamine dehydrogenase accessory protein MauD